MGTITNPDGIPCTSLRWRPQAVSHSKVLVTADSYIGSDVGREKSPFGTPPAGRNCFLSERKITPFSVLTLVPTERSSQRQERTSTSVSMTREQRAYRSPWQRPSGTPKATPTAFSRLNSSMRRLLCPAGGTPLSMYGTYVKPVQSEASMALTFQAMPLIFRMDKF